MLARGTEEGVLVRQPLEVLASPDARVLVAKAGRRNEGRDAGVLQVEIVERAPLLGVRDGSGNGVLAEPTMLPEHVREEMLIRFGAGGGHGGGDHLAASPGNGDMRLVGEMAAKVGSVDQRRLGIGATLQLLIGPEQWASCRRRTACRWLRIGHRFRGQHVVLIEAMQILRHGQGRSGHYQTVGSGSPRKHGPA